ncbi:MFS transporter [Acetobacterium woodii]|uniref:Major facilitator superfamily MFS_1 transporter n=1 Tax=Acetobacterium woodii (strain ATCC 29683 / DSM 1030 / JCM 2381 / KCTC 1655 / WB1) TaxID=931626 RepID=H6LHS6_ACEWD|nr:MFS transporter [Acetobacterium woodii]AFA47255.1 major facilitator superfamily MFS_1 transporter [Acetobacterium woodii DSM 1030]
MKLNKEEISWILVDCGNSAYSMAVTTALLPIVFGMFENVKSSMDLGYFNSIASIFVALLSPVLGTIADYKDKKKRFFVFFTLLGVLATMSLAFVSPSSGQWQLLIFFFVLSAIGFSGANIFYDAFIVDVASNERMDKVSSLGFAYGYIASVIPFGISLVLIFLMGMDEAIGYQIGFIITALWWGLFTIPMIKDVKQRHYIEPEPRPITNSFKRLADTFRNIKSHKIVFVFLTAYFFYIDGVGTIIKMVVPYATEILGTDSLNTFTLLGILLIIQLIAFPCAILYGNLAKKFSAKMMIMVGIFTYIISCVAAMFITSVGHVFILGAMIGSAQGGIQALSRSYYAKIIPKEKSNEFFGFYNIFGKFSAIVGPAIMALTSTLTGNVRLSMLGIIPLFVIGLIIFMALPADQWRDSEVLE